MSKTILVVDDDPTILMITEMILNKAGYQAIGAKSGLEALASLEQHQVDLLLLDIVMPFMDGFETLERIRRGPKGRDLPVIFLTGQADLNTVTRARDLQARDYILKPIQQSYLLSKVKQALGGGSQ